MQNWWTFEERAFRAFKVWKSLSNKVFLPVKRISYFLILWMVVVFDSTALTSRYFARKTTVKQISFFVQITVHVQNKIAFTQSEWNQGILTDSSHSTKINRPGHKMRMCWTNFWQPAVHAQQNIFEKPLIDLGSPHLYASFGTFCDQIGQLFASRRVLKH